MSDGCFVVREAFAARSTRFLGIERRGGWRLKRYAIVGGGRVEDVLDLDAGVRRLIDSLPVREGESSCPGVGFVIQNLGSGWDYLVCGWWSNENEMCVRMVSRRRGEREWGVAGEGQSFCVWDMGVMWHERNAYVEHVLREAMGDLDGYLADRFEGESVG